MDYSQMEAFCKNWLASWTGNQPEKLIQFYAENAYYCDPAKPQGICGQQALLNYFRKLLAKYPTWIWTMVEIFPYSRGFILKWEASLFENKDSVPFFGLDIVELDNGKIIRNEVYFNLSALTPLKMNLIQT